jgi:tRNA A-37 threonylcarbamoyl transferase component Bud32
VADDATTSLPEDRGCRVRCPHCGNRIQLVEPEPREVVCGSCGSSFKLDPNATTSHRPDKLPGHVGRFAVLGRLGRGAFGTVYKARDPGLDRVVAVKVPRAGTFATAEEEARFLREARAAARLTHPGIVSVYEVSADGEAPAIVSELVDGPTLADRLTAGRLTFREAAEMVAALADALDYAHRQRVVHRDVKPSNILLAGSQPKLADFGLARRDGAEITVTLDGQVLGTPAYMAPEQAAGSPAVDSRADVYSLGVILYELLTGELPFRGNARMLLHQVLHDDPRPPRKVNDHVPRDLETVVLKAMAKSPARRYSTAGELAADLRRWLDGRPVLARPTGRLEKAWRWGKRNRAVSALLAAVILVLAAGATTSTIFAVWWKASAGKLEAELKHSERREGELAVDRGQLLCEQGQEKAGLLWLARGLDLLERTGSGEDERRYARTALSLWGQRFAPDRWPLGQDVDPASEVWYFPDHRSYITETRQGRTLRWLEAETGRVLRTYSFPERADGRRIDRVKMTDDQRWLLAVLSNSNDDKDTVGESYLVLDTDTGHLITQVAVDRRADEHSYWDDDLRWIITRDRNTRTATLTNLRTGAKVADLVPTPPKWAGVEFSFADRTILARGPDKALVTWDADTGRRLAVIRPWGQGEFAEWDAALRPDGREVMTVLHSGVVQRWDTHNGRPVGPAVQLPTRRRFLASTSHDGQWAVVSAPPPGDLLGDSLECVAAWAWDDQQPWPHAGIDPDHVSPNGSIGLFQRTQLINVRNGERIGAPLLRSEWVERFDRTGRVLVVTCFERLTHEGTVFVRCYDARTGRRLGPNICVSNVIESGTVFDPGRLLVTPQRLLIAPRKQRPNDNPSRSLEVWHLHPVEGPPQRVTLWAEVLTGMELDGSGATRSLDAAALADRKQRLDDLGGPPLPSRP